MTTEIRRIDLVGVMISLRREALQRHMHHLPDVITYKGKGANRGKRAKIIKVEAPEQCPHCERRLDLFQHFGCDGDFCFGITACSRHPLEVYPYVHGPH